MPRVRAGATIGEENTQSKGSLHRTLHRTLQHSAHIGTVAERAAVRCRAEQINIDRKHRQKGQCAKCRTGQKCRTGHTGHSENPTQATVTPNTGSVQVLEDSQTQHRQCVRQVPKATQRNTARTTATKPTAQNNAGWRDDDDRHPVTSMRCPSYFTQRST